MSNTAIGTWSIQLNPRKQIIFEIPPFADLRITNAALDAQLEDENSRSTVILHIEDIIDSENESDEDDEDKEDVPSGHRKFALTSLTPGKVESSMHDIVVTRPARVTAEVIGKNTIHLAGYYFRTDTDESDDDGEYMMDEDEEEIDSDEEGYALHDVPSDVEFAVNDLMSEDELPDDSHRFEEVIEEEEKVVTVGKKRPREADEMLEGPAPEASLSKKQKKKLKAQQAAAAAAVVGSADASAKPALDGPPQKKVKATNGTAVPVEKKAEDKEAKPKEKKKEAKTDKPAQGKAVEHPNGLKTTDTKVGDGAVAKKGSKVSVRYIGKLTNGKMFDSNIKSSPFQFKLGAGDVIQGWDQGLVGMKEGGERRIVVPPKLGYGQKKMGNIPANSVLEFEVKLLNVK